MKRAPLTERQAEAMLFIQWRHKVSGFIPSQAEIGAAMGTKSKGAPARLIDELVERGYLGRVPRKARGLTIKRRIVGVASPASQAAWIAHKLREDAPGAATAAEREGMRTAAKHYDAVAKSWRA